ncbi:MAG TPA: arginase family protein [archaeon]|nr:arginase family protein [archaeon]
MFKEEESDVIVFGVPLGKFSNEELEAIREASWFVEPYDVDRRINLLENVRVFDSGNIKLKSLDDITEMTNHILEKNKIPLMLGGNHLSSLFALKAFPKDMKIITFDAHSDLKFDYIDEKLVEMGTVGKKKMVDSKINDSTWLRRHCEHGEPRNVMSIGMRSADEDDVEFAKESGLAFYTSEDIRNRMDEIKQMVNQFTNQSNVYVSLDIDVFDPGIAPAVDYPEPAGIDFNEFKKLINSIEGKIVGLDVCCLKPIKNNQITEFLAVKSIFEILGKI